MRQKELDYIESTAEKAGWGAHVYEDKNLINVEFEAWTVTAGQDVLVYISVKDCADIGKELKEYYENYDPEEECKIYIKNDMLGKRGVPSSIRTLLQDMDEADELIEKLSKAFEEAEYTI